MPYHLTVLANDGYANGYVFFDLTSSVVVDCHTNITKENTFLQVC